uniref:Ubiquinone biosynthesis protein COQ4 homolog, mitochondrial n=1 Tax=Ditylenchus dipsaci TaxID=166011 RepID=A0A915E9X5_9BILA
MNVEPAPPLVLRIRPVEDLSTLANYTKSSIWTQERESAQFPDHLLKETNAYGNADVDLQELKKYRLLDFPANPTSLRFDIPDNLSSFFNAEHAILFSDSGRKDVERILLLGRSANSDWAHVVVYLDGDGTFEMCSAPFKQVYVVLADRGDGFHIPIAHALLPNKKRATYDKMWSSIKSKYPTLQPEFFSCDFGATRTLHQYLGTICGISMIVFCKTDLVQTTLTNLITESYKDFLEMSPIHLLSFKNLRAQEKDIENFFFGFGKLRDIVIKNSLASSSKKIRLCSRLKSPSGSMVKESSSLGGICHNVHNESEERDMIATMAETTRDSTGQQLLRNKPRISGETIDREYIRSLPDGTLGREYARFLDGLQTSPDARPPVQYIDDDELVYVMQRYRETHDFTHTLLEMRPNMLGEVTVKYFEAIQLGLPMCITAAIFGGTRLGPQHREQLLKHNLPWVVEQAKNSRFLLAVDWENRFEQKVWDMQSEFNIQPFSPL